ncbi:MAG: hypothetical protein ACE5DX_05735 [Candidatus Dojkabacteria bacterium]
MFGSKSEPCGTCVEKSKLIDQLMKTECVSCVNLKHEVEYLKSLIEKRDKDWHDERAEFKRTVDSLMELAGSRPVGQGHLSTSPEKIPTMEQIMGIFDEDDGTSES